MDNEETEEEKQGEGRKEKEQVYETQYEFIIYLLSPWLTLA